MHRLGDREAGLNLQRDGVNRWYDTGAKLHTTHCEIGLADSYLYDGEVAAAGRHLAAARTHRTSYGENYLAAEIQRLEALLLLREGAPFAIVREHLTNGMGIAYQQGARSLELRCATTLAHLLAEKGEHREARDLLAPVYGWFTEGFDTADLKEAKALLDELV
jgi:predicted ATPase